MGQSEGRIDDDWLKSPASASGEDDWAKRNLVFNNILFIIIIIIE